MVRPATSHTDSAVAVGPTPGFGGEEGERVIVDSGCSQHMTSDKNWFSSLKQAPETESIIFGDASTIVILTTRCVKRVQFGIDTYAILGY
uniref:Retrovirus-related Pol polyprotein from transposon TNT 1-94-like beta-barrel domain-containing protein n=1 Tax=Oryza sativa subsp. japonica TaxID=39947 RepID=Q2QUZ3_ORYSJ|nr:hypothetical protein LOC_Os12g14590 [Oryza sativa Japonica Group]